jgi:hypothetical protein
MAPTGQHWDDPAISRTRLSIKRHYLMQQDYHCCYCQMQNRTSHGRVWDVEHVVARSSRPEFMFEPRNLAVACPDCNNAKSDEPVLVDPGTTDYPERGEAYVIIHPHFDQYEDHIAIHAGRLYQPKSDKGSATVVMCNLLRYSYKHVGWDAGLADDDCMTAIAEEFLDAPPGPVRQQKKLELAMRCGIQLSRTHLP